jgi:hypothetical protein
MERFNHLTNRRLKRSLVLALLLLCFISVSFAQSANALYLKDGSRIVGYVLDLDSAGFVSLKTTEGERLYVPMANVDNINWSYAIKPSGAGAIYRYADRYRWVRNDTDLSDRDYERFFDADLYHAYITGSNLFNIGGACWLYSVACLAFSIWSFDFDSSCQSTSFYVYAGGTGVLACLGAVFTKMGKKRLDWVERTFNSQNAASNELSSSSGILNSIKLNPSIMFTAQRDISFGASLSLTF